MDLRSALANPDIISTKVEILYMDLRLAGVEH